MATTENYPLNIKSGSISAFNMLTSKDSNTIYFVDASETKTYLYKGKINIIPQLLEVTNGGTGKTSFKEGALLVGAGEDVKALDSIPPASIGSILMSNGYDHIPFYGKPDMTWDEGSTEGPVFKYIINGVQITGAAIPAANSSASGVVTINSQIFNGVKTFTDGININNVELRYEPKLTANDSSDTLIITFKD